MTPLVLLGGFKNYLLIGGFVVLGAFAGVQTVRLAGAKTEIAVEQKERAEERDARSRVALRDAERVAALVAGHAAQQQENTNAFKAERKTWVVADGRRRAESDSLRNTIAAFAAGDRNEASGDPAACRDWRDRSERLGSLLGEAVDLAGEGESLVRQRDGEVKFLLGQVRTDRALLEGNAK